MGICCGKRNKLTTGMHPRPNPKFYSEVGKGGGGGSYGGGSYGGGSYGGDDYD